MISVIELEKSMVGASILGVVISKLRYKKKPCLIILLKVDKSLEVNFHHTILPLSLAVCLRLKSNEKSPLNAKEIT